MISGRKGAAPANVCTGDLSVEVWCASSLARKKCTRTCTAIDSSARQREPWIVAGVGGPPLGTRFGSG